MPNTKTPTDAIALLKADHRKVEGLFEKFEIRQGLGPQGGAGAAEISPPS